MIKLSRSIASTDKIELGKIDMNNAKFEGYVYDLYITDSLINTTTKLDDRKSTYGCHPNCGQCHGPTNFDCNEFIQLTHPWHTYSISPDLTFNGDEGHFTKRSDYGLDSTWVGWIQENNISSNAKTYIYSQKVEGCTTCTVKAVYY